MHSFITFCYVCILLKDGYKRYKRKQDMTMVLMWYQLIREQYAATVLVTDAYSDPVQLDGIVMHKN